MVLLEPLSLERRMPSRQRALSKLLSSRQLYNIARSRARPNQLYLDPTTTLEHQSKTTQQELAQGSELRKREGERWRKQLPGPPLGLRLHTGLRELPVLDRSNHRVSSAVTSLIVFS